eukprot:gene19919-26623_t
MEPGQRLRATLHAAETNGDTSSILQLEGFIHSQAMQQPGSRGFSAILDMKCQSALRKSTGGVVRQETFTDILQAGGLPSNFRFKAPQKALDLVGAFKEFTLFSAALQQAGKAKEASTKPTGRSSGGQRGGFKPPVVVAAVQPAQNTGGTFCSSTNPRIVGEVPKGAMPDALEVSSRTRFPAEPSNGGRGPGGSDAGGTVGFQQHQPSNGGRGPGGSDTGGTGGRWTHTKRAAPDQSTRTNGGSTTHSGAWGGAARRAQDDDIVNDEDDQAPRSGLTRPQKRPALGQGAAANIPKGFLPPYAQKSNNGGGGAGGGGAGGEGESAYSEKVLELLAGPDGQLPPEIEKLDPKTVDQVCNEILDTGANISWDDIAGQVAAKRLIQEMVVWPMQNPHLFTGPRAPPKGLLLFGPPGTGKTLIGKAIASNINATFFSISSSSLTSKWIGEGEKMVRALFAVAGCLQPSVIFIDEIDSVLSARKAEGEHEASRRLKTEMLIQMEGCTSDSADKRVLLIGATNRPEELDEAARRRMPKQLYIPLPCEEARQHMVTRVLGPRSSVRSSLSSADLHKLTTHTAGYSGSDMRNLIQEACQGPVRDAVARLGSAVSSLSEEDLRPVQLRDFQIAAKAQKASVHPSEVVRYEDYNERHGAKYVEMASGVAGGDQLEEDEEEW